ncbi:hypothetical protein J7T55_004106 [Diaporthe amygdali]|uniref:uncharacterized protein n=1 Tax=Phomopsis amygdali TaxID=1214568 RepID=UPI0022FED1C2|nr:uncharacterized protein J7T55_004106 [Diaporthe amygdali]KAJ0115936.1 hypothetical protein J7T55_004106 [Diaporthe amygdali]
MAPIARRLTYCAPSYLTAGRLIHGLPQRAPCASPPACVALLRQKRCHLTTSATPTTPATSPRPNRSRRRSLPESSSLLSHRRSYHSYDHPPSPGLFSPTERAILTAAYAHIPQHGFTLKALALGARDAGYLDISTNLLTDGVFTLVQWHLVAQREALAGKAKRLFEDEEAPRLGLGAKVEMLTWERLMGNKHVIGKLQEALAIMAQPSCVPVSLGELAKLSDEIWFLVGDTAVDPSWYTKRASLSTIYASTELFMTTDHSDGFSETRKFLQRRLAETQEIGAATPSAGPNDHGSRHKCKVA